MCTPSAFPGHFLVRGDGRGRAGRGDWLSTPCPAQRGWPAHHGRSGVSGTRGGWCLICGGGGDSVKTEIEDIKKQIDKAEGAREALAAARLGAGTATTMGE